MLMDSLAERFLEKVNHLPGEDACWEWTAWIDRDGYGRIREGGRGSRRLTAPRVAWEIANGPVPAGMVVRHTCDNPSCVRPSHLEIGTHADNNHDMAARRRGRRSRIGLPHGVSYNGSGWQARAWSAGRTRHLGVFSTIAEASAVVERERTRLYGPAPEMARAA